MAIVKDIDITPEQRQLVCSIFATHLPDTEVWAYGSRVHWNATPSSDLDLVAFCSDKSGLANCRDAFAESSLPFRVDLFLWDEIPENFQDRIKQEYAVLISKKEVKWDKVKLAETVSLLGDGLHGTPIYNPNGVYTFINGNNLSSGFIIVKEDTKRVSVDEYNKYKKDLTDRTVLVSINGTIGNVALYRGEKCILGKSACYLNVKKEYSRKFIYYVLTHPNFQNYAVSVATGTTIKNVSLKQMRDYEFFCPPLPEQKRIAGILSAFDDKIELNRKMSKMLEAMAEALFKSWFVDFEPVRAKIAAIENGKDPELAAIMSISGKTEVQLAEMKTFYPDAYSELAHTASLFPSVMVESEQGKIPEGWEIRPLDTIADFLNGLAMQKYPASTEETDYLPVIKIAQLNQETTEGADHASLKVPQEYVIHNGDVLFSWSGSLNVVLWCGGKGALNQHLFKVSSTKYPKWFYYFWTKRHLPEFQRIASDKAVTMGHIQRKHLSQAQTIVPPASLLNNSCFADMLNKILLCKLQNITLKMQRDQTLTSVFEARACQN